MRTFLWAHFHIIVLGSSRERNVCDHNPGVCHWPFWRSLLPLTLVGKFLLSQCTPYEELMMEKRRIKLVFTYETVITSVRESNGRFLRNDGWCGARKNKKFPWVRNANWPSGVEILMCRVTVTKWDFHEAIDESWHLENSQFQVGRSVDLLVPSFNDWPATQPFMT